MTPLLVLSCLAAVSGGRLPQLFPPPLVQYAPSATYHYRYAAPLPAYSLSSGPLVLRTAVDSPAGPAGTLVTLRNSKDSPFLLEMLAERLDERAPPTITRLQSVLVEAAPVFTNSKVSDALLDLRLESEASGGAREQELQLRDPGDAVVVEAAPADTPADTPAAEFVNAKESETLRVLRLQSLQDLTGRRPPEIVGDAVIVEAEVDGEAVRAS